MPDRFFSPGPWTETIQLDEAESHHLARVCRKQTGDAVELFNGRGESARAVVARIDKRAVDLTMVEVHAVESSPSPRITLAVAPPKGDRLRWLIEKATELGVDRLIPLTTARSVVDPRGQKLAKLEQTVIAACKQSGRNRLMEIEQPLPLDRLKERIADPGRLLVGSPAGKPAAGMLLHLSSEDHERVAVIGPEGGFTHEELDQLVASGALPISVSPHTLRVETAAIAFAGILVSSRMASGSMAHGEA